MIKIEDSKVLGFDSAIRGMRNPMNSWDKSDSCWCYQTRVGEGSCKEVLCNNCVNPFYDVGYADIKLMQNLSKAGNDHAKFLRMINVTCDITSNHFWWSEYDTYKVGTVRNSCSKMHKIHVKEFVKDDFSTEAIDQMTENQMPWAKECFDYVLGTLNDLRALFNTTGNRMYWRAMLELLPMGYNIKATVQFNYQVLKSIYFARKNHKLDEWHDFCAWCETLPYFKLICIDPMTKEN